MKLRKSSVVLLALLSCIFASTGCSRALRDGVSIGVTDGLSSGIAELVSGFVTAFDFGIEEE